MGRVLVQRNPHGAADRVLQRDHRHHLHHRHRRGQRGHDPVRLAPGADEPAGPDIHHDAPVLVRHDRRAGTMARHRHQHHRLGDGPRFRLRHHRRPVHLLLQLRAQPVAAVPPGRSMVGLRLR